MKRPRIEEVVFGMRRDRGPVLRSAAVRVGLTVLALLGGAGFWSHAWAADRLRLAFEPQDIAAPVTAGKRTSFVCPAEVTPPRSLNHSPKFRAGDASASELDSQRYAQEQAAVAGLRQFNQIVVTAADRALTERSSRDLAHDCVLTHLTGWANAGALEGPNSMQGDFERKWGSITYALTYAEARERASAAQVMSVERWLRATAVAVLQDYGGPSNPAPLPKTENNHAYWAALSIASIGVALNDREYFDWSMARFLAALGDIGPNGTLPLELKRGGRALEYHRFALEPLLLLALLARSNGITIPAALTSNLRLLVDVVQRGTADPEVFRALTGKEQVALDATPQNVWVWAELANALFPDPALAARIAPLRPLSRTWLGGSLTLRYARAR